MKIRLAVLIALVLAVAACTSVSSTPGTRSAVPPSASSSVPVPSSAAPAPSAPATASAPSASVPGPLTPVHDPGQVTGTLTGPCHTSDNGQLPDPRCTPGSYDPAVTQANLSTTLCVRHVSSTGKVTYDLSAAWLAGRPPTAQTDDAKFNTVDPAYGIPVTVKGELDHLVAREIGGSNDISNLWLEAGSIPNPKDAVENASHQAVCAGQMTLAVAQYDMATNWIALGQRLGVK